MDLSLAFQVTATSLTIGSVLSYAVPNSKSLNGPVLGVLSQFPWWGLMIVEDLWGLLLMNIFMLFSHLYNFYRRL